jgi:hypothetical protein
VNPPKKRPVRQREESRESILGTIKNPLVFFALALLIIEGIIGLVVTQSKMTGDQQFDCVILMAVLFLAVVGSVAWITIRWPTHLYESISQITRDVDALKSFVESSAFQDAVVDIVEERLTPDRVTLPSSGSTDQALAGAKPLPEIAETKGSDDA